MNIKRIKIYVFPIFATLGFTGHCAFFLRWPAPIIWLHLINLPFYLGALLYTVPINAYTAVMIYKSVKYFKSNVPYIDYLISGLWTFTISILYWITFKMGWILTV